MMRSLGRLVGSRWAFFLAGWVALAVTARLLAPPWEQIAPDKEFAFLPADSLSRRSEKVFGEAFPDERNSSTIVLVLHRAENAPGQLDRDKKFVQDVIEPGLRRIAELQGGLADAPGDNGPLFGDESSPGTAAKERSIISRIRTPNAPGAGALLVSADRKALLVVVELTTEFLTRRNWPTIARIEDFVRDLKREGRIPPGVEVAITGSAVLGRDHALAQLQSACATELWTVLLVIGLLLLIYRAPLLAVIPLATVYLSVQLAISLLSILAETGAIVLFQGIQIYVTILAYGAGVDYCLFLTARYKEELDNGATVREGIAAAIGAVGAPLIASAATVMFGIGMMAFAEFGKFREAGIAIPLSIFLVLCATLTFSSALLCLTGKWAFWPQQPAATSVAVASDAPGEQSGRLHDMWEKVGNALLRRPGTIWLATVAAMAPFAILAGLQNNRLSYDMIGSLPSTSPGVVGSRVLQEHFPAGLMGPVTVVIVEPTADFSSDKGRAQVEQLTAALDARKEELGLADLRSLTAPLGVTTAAAVLQAGKGLLTESGREAIQQIALDRYVTDLGGRAEIGTRLDLILKESPFSQRSVEDLDQVEQAVRSALPASMRDQAQLYILGPTASVRDLQDVVKRDRARIEVLVLGSVFAVLVLLFRQIVTPIYLLLSVLFSYYATLGMAFAVFWLLDPQGFPGLDWKAAIFLFTILIAVGADYNILLMARITDEEKKHGPVRGVIEALRRTGPIISSCGIIMAGTFASLLTGSLSEMKQLGFALAFGVLLDTFVVRPLLVPTFLILLRTGRFSIFKKGPSQPALFSLSSPRSRSSAPQAGADPKARPHEHAS